MDEQQTCGRGLAEHSALPAQLAEVTEAMADNLSMHMQALELDDEPAREEHAVYLRLVEEQRQAAAGCGPWPRRWPPPATCPWAATTSRP
jgi:hypothetical protein